MTAVLGQLDRWNRQQLATIASASPLASSHHAFANPPSGAAGCCNCG
jgi:hypothetical protein